MLFYTICIENNILFLQYDDDWQDDMFNQYIDNNEEIANRINLELVTDRQLRSRLIRTYFH